MRDQQNKDSSSENQTDRKSNQKVSGNAERFVKQQSNEFGVSQLQELADNYLDHKHPIQKKNNTGLPDQLKSGIENLSGYSMDDVKVHYNSDKPAQLQAHAYAQGNQIHLAPGQEKHLPHEAWHVVQQKQGRVKPTKQLKSKVIINDDEGLEKEADVMGAKATTNTAQTNASIQRKRSGPNREDHVIQRYITFNPNQANSAMLGCGLAGYGGSEDDSGNIDLFIELLEEKYQISKEKTIEVLGTFFSDKKSISFKDYSDAAAFVLNPINVDQLEQLVYDEDEPELEEKPMKGLISAYRVDGSPKSDKQASDIQKLAPLEAFNQKLGKLEDIELKQKLLKSWEGYLKTKDNKKNKYLSTVHNDYRKEIRADTSFKPKEILEEIIAFNIQLKTELAQNERLASRIQVDNSYTVPRKAHSGTITGISESASLNFSVGMPDHAMYFNSTYTGENTQLIKFYLKKEKWAEWKINETGPQKKEFGPSAENATTTLNDINQPGVKYEVDSGSVSRFFKTVVAQDVPAEVLPMKKAAFKPEQFLEGSIARLKKANDKLTVELGKYEGDDMRAEQEQNASSTDLLKNKKLEGEALYVALNLTKNALHSIRRKINKAD